jgi:choline dehydrogenase-like flavoprotein
MAAALPNFVGPEGPYDVIIVGSGAGGGMSAYHLTHSGLKVLMLEAGRNYDPRVETPMFNIYAEAPLRGVGTPDKPFGFYDAPVDGGWEVPNEPYTVAQGSEPGRAHQPLGPHRAALWPAGLQALQP